MVTRFNQKAKLDYKRRRKNMKLLFIQGGSRVRVCNNNQYYVDGNFNNEIWKRYKSYCDELTIILRKIDKTFDEKEVSGKFNKIDTDILTLKLVKDIYSPKKNFFNIKLRKEVEKEIKNAVKNSDKVIIRSVGNFYTNTALKYCKKYKKEYLIEVTGFVFEGLWYHSILGKIVAIPRDLKLKKSIKEAPFAVYVTETALQKRYPCLASSLGCSDVEIKKIEPQQLEKRLERKEKKKIILGTAAFLDVKWKGHIYVIKALAELKKQGIENIEYQMIGSGTGKKIVKLANKLGVSEQVVILGAKKHEEVFNWLDEIDIYIQPSLQEGLCRAIVEAMSRGCPVVCTNIGGNYELIDNEFLFEKKKYKELARLIMKISQKEIKKEQSIANFERAKLYEKKILDKKRNEFYRKFIGDANEKDKGM